jgi:Metallo-peptidase family M12
MAISVRNLCNKLGHRGNISILKNFYGYANNGQKNISSLKKSIDLLGTKYFNINIIIVAYELYKDPELKWIDRFLEKTREIYGKYNFGIGSVKRFKISQTNSKGYEDIDSKTDWENLLEDFSYSGKAIDVFIVRTIYGDRIGKSALPGNCTKGEEGYDGLVVCIESGIHSETNENIALPHEIGHYFGLDHVCGELSDGSTRTECTSDHEDQLMYPVALDTAIKLTNDEINIINKHCFIISGSVD